MDEPGVRSSRDQRRWPAGRRSSPHATRRAAPVEVVFRSDYARLVALARLLLDRQADAEEVVQEAFARTSARRPRGAGRRLRGAGRGEPVPRRSSSSCGDPPGGLPVAPVRPTPERPRWWRWAAAEQQPAGGGGSGPVPPPTRVRGRCVTCSGHSTAERRPARDRRGRGQDPSEPRHGRARDPTGGLAMIDQQVRDALDAQIPAIDPERSAQAWALIGAAGRLAARRRQRRARRGAGRGGAGGRRHRGRGDRSGHAVVGEGGHQPDDRRWRGADHRRRQVAPPPAPSVAEPLWQATTMRRGFSMVSWAAGGSWTAARTAGDDLELVLTTSGCGDRFGAVVQDLGNRVSIELAVADGPHLSCLMTEQVRVRLARALDGRPLVDGAGRHARPGHRRIDAARASPIARRHAVPDRISGHAPGPTLSRTARFGAPALGGLLPGRSTIPRPRREGRHHHPALCVHRHTTHGDDRPVRRRVRRARYRRPGPGLDQRQLLLRVLRVHGLRERPVQPAARSEHCPTPWWPAVSTGIRPHCCPPGCTTWSCGPTGTAGTRWPPPTGWAV